MRGTVEALPRARVRARPGTLGPGPARPDELSPALAGLLKTFVPAGSLCLNLGPGDRRALRAWLAGHRCRQVEVGPRQATVLGFEDGSFDAALLIGGLDEVEDVARAAAELRRVLRPGGVLVVSAANGGYWRSRLERVARGGGPQPGAISPGALRQLLLEGGFSLVGVEGQDGAFVRDLPLAGRLWRRRGSAPYRAAERLFPALLGSRVGAFAIRV
jgi:SAM-dependent methyltransferase